MKLQEINPTVLIIGYGSSLRGDDGAGSIAVEMLAERFTGHDVQVRRCHQLMPELAESISRAEVVIFVDACRENRAGEVTCRLISPRTCNGAINHAFAAEILLVMAQRLYGRCPTAYAFTIGGEYWGLGETLSPRVSAALTDLVNRIVEFATREIEAVHA